MIREYKIEDLYIAHELKYGLIIVIEAHPVVNLGAEVVSDDILELFFFPYDEQYFERLLEYHENNDFIRVEGEDYHDEIVFDEKTESDIKIVRHCSFRDMPYYNFIGARDCIEPAEIPNFQQKLNYLTKRFKEQHQEDEFSDYIVDLAQSDQRFFAWLFEKQYLNRLTMYQQSPDKSCAFDNWIYQLKGMDEYLEDERTPIKIQRNFYPPSYENWDENLDEI